MTQNFSNKTIAKNTIYLYIRMLFTIVVSLYTSRVILNVLGIDDYGLYQAVGGIVGFLSFLNGALSSGTSRFLTYEIGKGNSEKLKKTFSTTLSVHLIIATIVAIIAETGGMWFLYNKLVVPTDRFSAAVLVFHFSIFTTFISLIQVPFNATIIAHEKMSFFSILSIIEVISKLGILFILKNTSFDKLAFYSVLLLVIHSIIFLCYVIYCRKFSETKTSFSIDKKIYKEIINFSGWSLFANGSIALNTQGIIILINMFFTSPVVVARTISLQVNNAAIQLVNSFRLAVNPQIVKKLAIGDFQGSKQLLLLSTKFSFYLMFVICLPLYFLSYPILRAWLGQVPEYSVKFLQLILIQSLFQVFDTSFYTALYAKGRIKENALLSPSLSFLMFFIVFLMFKYGSSPIALSWVFLILYAILGLVIKPILIIKIAGYRWLEIYDVFRSCFLVLITATPIPLFLYYFLDSDTNIWHSIILLITTLLIVIVSVWLVGLTKNMKKLFLKTLMKMLLNR